MTLREEIRSLLKKHGPVLVAFEFANALKHRGQYADVTDELRHKLLRSNMYRYSRGRAYDETQTGAGAEVTEW